MEPLTPEQQEDITTRVTEFRQRYLDNVAELEVDFVCFPQYQQQPEGYFVTVPNMQMVDKRYMPVPSPFTEPEG